MIQTTVKLGYSNIGFCDTLSIASNIQWYALIPHKAYSFITTLFLGPFDDVITKFYCNTNSLTLNSANNIQEEPPFILITH
jgi:hypothetical protein